MCELDEKLDGRSAAEEQEELLDDLSDLMGSKMCEVDDPMGGGGRLDGRGMA